MIKYHYFTLSVACVLTIGFAVTGPIPQAFCLAQEARSAAIGCAFGLTAEPCLDRGGMLFLHVAYAETTDGGVPNPQMTKYRIVGDVNLRFQ